MVPFVKLSPLICKQTVVARNECIFELNSISDKVTVNLTPLDQTLTVNFRSDVPSSRFLTIHYQNGKILNVDIVDGYLLTVNHLIHSLKFISGGDWHQLSIDLVNQLLYVDSMVTAVSIAPVNKDNHKKMITAIEFNLNGQITNLKLNTENSQLCDGSPRLQIHRTELFLRKICPHYEANYCHCKGPNSVFGTSKNNTPFSCPVEIKTNNAFQLARTQDQLAFFYIPKFDYHSTISVLFKSDSNSGLIFFGTTTSEKSKETSIMQVHFVNENIYAMQCFKTDHHVRRCQACTLKRKNGFAVDNWIRVSMFHYSEYHFLTVDEHICQLVPNSLDAEGALIYKISENVDKALFVGGMMYAKSSSLWKKMNAESINPFIDTTREKPPSLRGCISELYVNGEKQDLSKLFTEQVALFSKDSNNDAFSMIPRCNSCSEESVCHGARCRPATANLDSESICDCASIFSIKKPNSQSCMLPDFVDTNVTLKNEEIVVPNLLLSHDAPVLLENIKFFGNRRALLDKVFILIRFPVTSDNLVTILDFGSIRVLVGNKGTRIVIEIDFAHREEFTINNNDNRLNLLNFERTPTIGTSSESRSIKVQLNDDIRYVPIEEIPLVNGAELTISPIASQTNIQNPGCISSFSVSYEYKEASHKHYIENRVDQKDVLHMIVTELRKQDPLLASKLIQSNPCGIRDSNLWASPSSSSIGMMAEYTPDPFSQPRLSSINWKHFLSFLVIIMVVVLLCICISLNCILRIRRRGSYKTKNLNDAGTNGYNIIKKPIPKDKYDSHPRKKRSRLANNGEQDYLNYDVTTADSPKTTSTHTPPSPDEWQRQPVRASRTYIERISLPKTQHTSPYDTPLTGKTSRSNKYSYNDDSFLNDSINFGDTPSSYVYKAPIALAEEDFRGVTSKNP
uniref:LAM_G_DOMAIN domain-containing protein n=1 Tax=Rhabditophanes sp. KR3021 TaxID=114890 RepID=A0AC35TSN4_9BILA